MTLEQKEVFRNIKVALIEAQNGNLIIPNVVFEIIEDLEIEYA